MWALHVSVDVGTPQKVQILSICEQSMNPNVGKCMTGNILEKIGYSIVFVEVEMGAPMLN